MVEITKSNDNLDTQEQLSAHLIKTRIRNSRPACKLGDGSCKENPGEQSRHLGGPI